MFNTQQHNAVQNLAYPFRVDGRGRIAGAGHAAHIQQLIEQVLFTAPGERVNRPEFGSGVRQLIFSPNSEELAAASQFLVQGALEQWLGELIQVEDVEIFHRDAELVVTVRYLIRKSQEQRNDSFSSGAVVGGEGGADGPLFGGVGL